MRGAVELMGWTLRQRRYRRILAAMTLVALGCLAAGTFEAHRYQEKRRDNGALVTAAHAAPVPLTTGLVPLTSGARLPGIEAVRLRRVTVRGRYDVSAQTYVGNVTQGGHQGFYVLTPLRTAAGVLLVARGFVAAPEGSEQRPSDIAAPPSGTVTVAGRLEPGQRDSDRYGVLGRGEIASVNPVQQSARLGAPVYAAWVSLTSGSAGTAGLDLLPAPDLSNPSGGARQWQLLSYVVQWYAFAVLALLAPFLFSRAELREARRRFLGVDDDAEQLDALVASPGSGIVLRGAAGELARVDPDSPRYRQAARLADRYGRSLSVHDRGTTPRPAEDAPVRRRESIPDADRATFSPQATADSRRTPHRSVDEYQGSYNDYLWQLAMASGDAPAVGPDSGRDAGSDAGEPRERANTEPRIVDVDPGPDPSG